MIHLRRINKFYGSTQVLKDCSASFAAGEVAVICGPSGSGKSTFIKCINGLEPISSGEVEVFGSRLDGTERMLRAVRRRIGMVFQNFELYPHLTVTENITLAPRKVLGRRRADAERDALRLLERVGLADHARKYPGQLSGGQQQRVAIARSLAMKPDVVLFDEPTSSLDPEMIAEVLDVMTDLARDGMTMIVVTHEMGFARRVAQRVLFMCDGEIVEDRKSEEFFAAPASDRASRFLAKILQH
jgi:glutamate/aspartate transport system ATP-binding protein